MGSTVVERLGPLAGLLDGGALSLWLVGGGLIAVYLAYRAVRMAVRLVALATAAVLWLGTAPWLGEPVTGPVADCAAAAVEADSSAWQTHLATRVTVEEVSADAACAPSGTGLAAGSAEARSRTFGDLPFVSWRITPDGATARWHLPSTEPAEARGR